MRVMFVSKELNGVSGANAGTKMHLHTIQKIVGINNVYVVDISWNKAKEETNYVAFGKYKGKIEHLIRNLQGNTVYISNKIIKEICRRISREKIDVVFIDDSIIGRLAKKIKQQHKEIPVISFYHDVKINLYPQWLKEKGIRFVTECLTGIYNERLNQKYCDINVTLNDRENEVFKKHYHRYSDYLLPVSLDNPGRPKEKKDRQDLHKILFVGKYYYPNVKGIEWFCKNVLSRLDNCYQLIVVGYGMEKLQNSIIDSRVSIRGAVSDLTSVYREADIVIGPIFDGAGMKVKTAEAFSYGKAFVGTAESLIGYKSNINKLQLGNLIVEANSPDSFADAIKELIRNGASEFNESIYEMYLTYYSDLAAEKMLREILSNAQNDFPVNKTIDK